MVSYLIINIEDSPLADGDRTARRAFKGDPPVDPSSLGEEGRAGAVEEATTRPRPPVPRPASDGSSDRSVLQQPRRAPAGSFIDAEALAAELSEFKLASRTRRKQLKQLRKAGTLFGDVLARGFLTAYLLHLCDEHPRHGNEILNEIEERTDGLWAPSSGGVYTLLRKLEKRGLLEGSWETGTTRERRVYRITTSGRAALDEFRELAPPRIAAASRVLRLVGEDLLSKPVGWERHGER